MQQGAQDIEMRLEVVPIPVSDVDAAKAFYTEQVGFRLDHDVRPNAGMRVVQMTPSGSACSVTLMRNEEAAGSVQGLHLVVDDLPAAREELTGRGVAVSEPFHFSESGQTPGLHPERADFGSFATFADPDGTGWLLQEKGGGGTSARVDPA